MYKRTENIKIDENLTTNVLIYIYFIFFYIKPYRFNLLLSVVVGTTGKSRRLKRGGGVGGCARLDTFGILNDRIYVSCFIAISLR